MDLNSLKKFIAFMEENSLCELEIEEEGKKIRLKKFTQDTGSITPVMFTKQAEEAKKSEFIEIKSPMVGTFYQAPSPGAKSYAEKGQTISQGDVVCIIEAMKLMNEIKSDITGEIVDVLAENGEPVEFNQPLFLVKPV